MNLYKKGELRPFLPVLIVFIFVSSFCIIFRGTLNKLNIDQYMLLIGNMILFLVTSVSFLFHRKALLAGNTHLFLRNVYSAMGVKFFLCLLTAFVYIFYAGSAVNKPGLFTLMSLYLVYTFLEITVLMKVSKQIKQNKNG